MALPIGRLGKVLCDYFNEAIAALENWPGIRPYLGLTVDVPQSTQPASMRLTACARGAACGLYAGLRGRSNSCVTAVACPRRGLGECSSRPPDRRRCPTNYGCAKQSSCQAAHRPCQKTSDEKSSASVHVEFAANCMLIVSMLAASRPILPTHVNAEIPMLLFCNNRGCFY